MIATADWSSIGTAAALAFIAFISVWNKRDISRVHTLVNSQYGESLRIGMVSAEALRIAKPTADNIRMADEARVKWEDHVAKQAALDGINLK